MDLASFFIEKTLKREGHDELQRTRRNIIDLVFVFQNVFIYVPKDTLMIWFPVILTPGLA